MFRDYDEIKKEKYDNLQRSVDVFAEAQKLASQYGWELKRKNMFLFHLRNWKHNWLYNLWPSNQRIYADRRHYGPFLSGLSPIEIWTVLDVVKIAIQYSTKKLQGAENGQKTEKTN